MGKTEVIRLTPVFKETIWGGSRMREVFGYEIPGENTGECLAVSTQKNGDCLIKSGEYAGRTLSQLWEKHQELFGGCAEYIRKRDGIKDEASFPQFPLLTKILDAKEDLSIQVHPDDEYARANENGASGKTECWYILDCKPGETIVVGHNAKSKEELCKMIDEGRFRELIREIPIKKGDFLELPPGTVHSIKGGTLLLETQQNSDITYRLYDYDRLQNGKKRPLHIEQSKDIIKVPFNPEEKPLTGAPLKGTLKSTSLAVSRYYKVWKAQVSGSCELEQQYPFLICSVIEGSFFLGEETFKKGDHFIIPAGCKRIELNGEAEMIVSTV